MRTLSQSASPLQTCFKPSARSPKGAVGLMQLMPVTATRYGVKDLNDPAQNIDGGARYLRDLLTRFNDNISLAVSAYNAGEGAVERHGFRVPPYRETMRYVPEVITKYHLYKSN